MVLSCLPGTSLLPPRLSKMVFPASLVPPWCLAGCSKMVLSCLPGTSLVLPRLFKMVLSCLPGASLVPHRLSNRSFPASLVPPWCFAGCPISPFLPPWCFPGASQAVQMVLSCLPGASPVSKCFCAASRVSVAQDPPLKAFVAQTPLLKALVAWPPGSTPDFGRAPDFVYVLVQLQWRTARFAANPGVGPTAGCP